MRSAKHDERIVSDQKSFKWNSRILSFKLYRERLQAAQHSSLCVNMRSAKQDERFVSDQKVFSETVES